MASGENGSSSRLVQRNGHDNLGIVVVSPESTPRQQSNSRELHLPPIRPLKQELSDRSPVEQTLDDGQGVTANLSRRLSATDLDFGTHRINNHLSPRKETEDYSKTRENKSMFLRTKDRFSLCDDTGVEVDAEVKQRTELYRHGGRRFSLPVGRSSQQPARIQASGCFAAAHYQEGCDDERDASKALLDDTDTSPRRVDYYKRLGRRYSLPPQGLASTKRQTDAQQRLLTEGTASNSSRLGLLDSSSDTDDYFSCNASMRSNLTPLGEDQGEMDLNIERYIHRGRRCSLPPANHLSSRFKSSNHFHDHSEVPSSRVPTPIAADCPNLNGLYVKQSGFHTMKAAKSAESLLKKTELLPPSPWRDVPDLNANLPVRRPRGYRAKRDPPTGVTWETKPTHKTFSFTYNDTNNVSEMLTPPVTGGIVLKSLQADRPSEPQKPEPDSTTTEPLIVDNNKDTEHIHLYKPQEKKFISPTLRVLKDSWRRENNEEKTLRILRWIANEQSQRSNEDGY